MRKQQTTTSLIKAGKFLLFLLFSFFVVVVSAQTQKEKLQNQKKTLENEISSTNKLLEETRKNTKSNVQQVKLLEGQIVSQQQLVQIIQQEVAAINDEMKKLGEDITQLEKELEQLKKEYAEMIYFSYLTRSSHHRLMFVFAAESMNEAFQRYRYLQEYGASRRRQAELIVAKQNELKNLYAQLEDVKRQKFTLLKDQESQVSKLNKQKQEKDNTIKTLQSQEKKLRDDIKKKQQEAQKLQRQIEELIRKEIEAANKKTNTTKATPTSMPMTTEELEVSKGFSGNKGKLPWPVDNGVVTGKYGEHPHPVLSGIKIRNNGIDIATQKNTQVKAVFEGIVSAVFTLPNNTKAVIIRHGDYLTVYANLQTVAVKKDDKVKASTVLGTVSTDSEDNTTVFHFEVWKEKALENPELWLRKR